MWLLRRLHNSSEMAPADAAAQRDFGGMAQASALERYMKGACGLSPAGPRACGAPSARLFLVGLLPSRARLRFTGRIES